MPSKERLCRVTAPHFVAGILYVKVKRIGASGETWRVEKSAPILAWLRKLPVSAHGRIIKSRGWTYEWLPVNTPITLRQAELLSGQAE